MACALLVAWASGATAIDTVVPVVAVNGEVAVTASVVDRVTQDSRTILPVRCTPPPSQAP